MVYTKVFQRFNMFKGWTLIPFSITVTYLIGWLNRLKTTVVVIGGVTVNPVIPNHVYSRVWAVLLADQVIIIMVIWEWIEYINMNWKLFGLKLNICVWCSMGRDTISSEWKLK